MKFHQKMNSDFIITLDEYSLHVGPNENYILRSLSFTCKINTCSFLIFFQHTINMPCGKFFCCAICHNLGPSLTIIMDDENNILKKILC